MYRSIGLEIVGDWYPVVGDYTPQLVPVQILMAFPNTLFGSRLCLGPSLFRRSMYLDNARVDIRMRNSLWFSVNSFVCIYGWCGTFLSCQK